MARKSAVESSSSSAQQRIIVDKAEFIRTRDALLSSWARIRTAYQQAIDAYVAHSDAVLGGKEPLDESALHAILNAAPSFGPAMSTYAASVMPTTESAYEDAMGGGKKRKRGSKVPKPAGYPKRPVTAYFLFLRDNRDKISAELGADQKRGDISSEGTRRWNAMTKEEKQIYKDRYKVSFEKWKTATQEFLKEHGLPAEATAAFGTPAPDPDDDDEAVDGTDVSKIEPPTPAPKKRKTKAAAAAEPVKEPTPPPPPPAAEETDDDAEDDSDLDRESSVVSSDTDDESEAPASSPPVLSSPAKKAAPKPAPAAAAKPSAKKAAAVESAAAALTSTPTGSQGKAKKSKAAAGESPAKKTKKPNAAEEDEPAVPESSPAKKEKKPRKKKAPAAAEDDV